LTLTGWWSTSVLLFQLRCDSVANAMERREHAQKGERSSVDHLLPIDEHRQLTIVSFYELHVDAEALV
jgi:hypothetical protein